MFKKILLLLLSISLIGCGSGETDTSPEVAPLDETITSPVNNDNSAVEPTNDNTYDENQKHIVGETFSISDQLTHTADTYSSSDNDIASISDDGLVTVHKAGVAQITAENSSITEMTIVDILSKETQFYFKSWVGENDSLINFNDSLFGLTFISSTEESCQPILLVDCGNYDSSLIDGFEVVDDITTTETPGFYHFTFGKNTAATSMLSAEKFEVHSGEATIVFNDQLFLIRGFTTGDVLNFVSYCVKEM